MLWYGQAVSQLGDSVYFLVFLFMAKKASGGNDAIVGLVAALQAIPFLIFSPWAGQLADRIDRRRIMVISESFSAVVAVALAIWALYQPVPPIPVIATAGFLLSTTSAFFMPTRMAAIPRLVYEEDLMEANGLIISTQQLIGMVGIGISAVGLGVIYQVAPQYFLAVAAGANAITFGVSAAFISRLPDLTPDREPGESRTWHEIKDGVRAIVGNPLTRIGLPVSFVFSFFVSGFFLIYLEANEVWYGGGYATLAWVELAFSASVVVGSMAMHRFRVTRPGFAYGLAMIGVGLTVCLMAFGEVYAVFIFWNIICGLCLPFAWIPMSTYLQMAFEDHLRGRVNSVWNMVQMGVQPLGLGLTGPALQQFGLFRMFWIVGIGMTSAAMAGLAFRGFRDEKMPRMELANEPGAAVEEG